MELQLLSVNVALPRVIGRVDGQDILSGIAKQPLEQQSVFVATTNIAGDAQADLRVHGGVDKAVYAYPADHWPWWEQEKMLPCRAGTFGENSDGRRRRRIGCRDRGSLSLGRCDSRDQPAPRSLLQVCHSHGACRCPQLMTLSGRCGWYYRVIEEGRAPVPGCILVACSRKRRAQRPGNISRRFRSEHGNRSAQAGRGGGRPGRKLEKPCFRAPHEALQITLAMCTKYNCHQ